MKRSIRSITPALVPAALALALAPSSASANGLVPIIDVQAQAGLWQPMPVGTVSSDGDEIDFEDDLNYDETDTNTFLVGLEHPIPLLPNVKVRHFAADDSAKGTIQVQRTFRGVTFSTNEDVRSEYDITMTDATLYYSPLNNWIQLDIGLTARQIDLEVLIESRDRDAQESASAEAVLPMGHIGARFDVPLAGLYAGGELDIISASGSSLRDTRVAVGYQFFETFEIEGGYRQVSFDIDEVDDLSADTDFEGAYAAATLRF